MKITIRFMWAFIFICFVMGIAALVGGCGQNITPNRGHKLEKGVYETHFTTQEGRKMTCLVLTKEFSSGDQHAVSITCPDFLNLSPGE